MGSAAQHARLAPSSAHRYLECPASDVMCYGIEDEGENRAADNGTITHDIGETMLHGRKVPAVGSKAYVFDGKVYYDEAPEGAKFKPHTVDQDQLDRAERYYHKVKETYLKLDPRSRHIGFEVKVPLGKITGEEGAKGTSDVVMFDSSTIEIHDLKDGYLPIYPKDNPQLMIYALAAIVRFAEFGSKFQFTKIALNIHQIKEGRHSRHEMTIDELNHWKATVLDKALIRINEAREKLEDHHFSPGSHCQYCRFNVRCTKLKDHLNQLYEVNRNMNVPYSEDDVAVMTELFKMLPTIKTLAERVEAALVGLAVDGKSIPGHKIALGREGNRKWSTEVEAEVANALEKWGVPLNYVYESKLVSPTNLGKAVVKDKIMDKKEWMQVEAELVSRAPASYKLVSEEADVPPVEPRKSSIEGFEVIE